MSVHSVTAPHVHNMMLRRSVGSSDVTLALASYCEPTLSLVGVMSMGVVRMYVLHAPKNGGELVPFKRRRQKKRKGER